VPQRHFNAESKSLFLKLGSSGICSGFYLGTPSCVPFHLAHREIRSLDFFTESTELEQETLVAELSRIGLFSIQTQSKSLLACNLDGVSVRFVSHPFPMLGQFERMSKISISSRLDCALDTLLEVSGRGSAIDFIDFYFILKSGFSLRDLIQRSSEKYSALSLSAYQLLRGCAWLENAENDVRPEILEYYKWQDVKGLLQKEVRRLFDARFPGRF
jgi:hypothetical protein